MKEKVSQSTNKTGKKKRDGEKRKNRRERGKKSTLNV